VVAEAQPRILIVRPDHLGDVLLSTPAIATLRQALPAARLTLMVGPWSAEVARRGPDVDEILTCHFPGFTRAPKGGLFRPYAVLLHEAKRLRGKYDLALILRPDHWWGALLAGVAGIRVRVGYDSLLTAPLLTHAQPLRTGAHVVQLSLDLARRAAALVGVETLDSTLPADDPAQSIRPVFRLEPAERAWAAAFAHEASAPLVLLHPGSGSPIKNWPTARWSSLADALTSRGARVVLTGGEDDLETPRAVAAGMQEEPLLLAGSTTLGQLGALAEQCLLAIGTDNGPLHLAEALGTPTLRIFGPTDQSQFGPWDRSGQHAVLTHQLPCRPCGNLIDPPCSARQEPPCLLGVDSARVIQAALDQLGVSRGPTASTRA
jgi:ADP-heptose:LPS heptosyltransferase